jgi:hypothetical protein
MTVPPVTAQPAPRIVDRGSRPARGSYRLPRLSAGAGELARVAAVIVLASLALAMFVAIVVDVLAGSWARRELALTFPGLPRTAGECWRVFSWNVRHLAAPLAAAALVGLRGPRPSALARCFELLIATFVLVTVAVNIVYVALALGGYGLRAVWWLVPHGLVELAGYATGLAVWAQAVRGRLTVRLGVQAAAVSVVLLAVAAAIETAAR